MEENNKICPICSASIAVDADHCPYCHATFANKEHVKSDALPSDFGQTDPVVAAENPEEQTVPTPEIIADPFDLPKTEAKEKSIPPYEANPVERNIPFSNGIQNVEPEKNDNKIWIWVAVAVAVLIAIGICCFCGLATLLMLGSR